MHALLLALTLTLPANPDGARFEVSATGFVGYRGMDTTYWTPGVVGAPPNGNATVGGGQLALDVFGRRLVDDDAAPPLQPFLQRAARFHLGAGGTGVGAAYPVYTIPPQAPNAHLELLTGREATAQVDASAEGYLGRRVFLGGGVHFAYQAQRYDLPAFAQAVSRIHDNDVYVLPLFLEAGVRWRDLRVLAGWAVTPESDGHGSMTVRFWGGAFAQADAVVRRWIAVGARVSVVDGGATADGWSTFWLRPRLGLSLGVGGGRGTGLDQVEGRVEAQYWLSPRWAASLGYAPGWTRLQPGTYGGVDSWVTHMVTLALTTRPR